MSATVVVTLVAITGYVVWLVLQALLRTLRGEASQRDWDRVEDAAQSGQPHHRGRSPYSTTDASKGVWCEWCECYHPE